MKKAPRSFAPRSARSGNSAGDWRPSPDAPQATTWTPPRDDRRSLDNRTDSGPPALQGQAGELAPAVSSGNAEAAIAAAPPEAQAFLADAAREAFLSGLNEIFLIAGVTALVGAALSLVLIRARDLHLDADDESAISPEPAAGDEQPALAA